MSRSVRAAAGAAGTALAGPFGLGGEPSEGPVCRRGALYVAVQVLTVGVVCAALFGLRQLIRGVAQLTPGPPLLGAAAFVLAVPLLIHWFARPPHRVGGALAACAVVVAGGLTLQLLVGWTTIEPLRGLAALVATFLVAGAVFGAVAPAQASPRIAASTVEKTTSEPPSHTGTGSG